MTTNNIYLFDNYNEFLKNLVYGPQAQHGIQARIAKAMGCQAAYLSQVLKEKAQLTDDHALNLASYLELDELETEYLLLLVRQARAATPQLRSHLERQRKNLQNTANEIKNRADASTIVSREIEVAKYFTTWVAPTIHVATSSPKLQTAEALSHRFGLSPSKVQEVLEFLQQEGLINEENGKWVFSGNSLHLPRESQLHIAHQVTHRHQAIRSIEILNSEDLHFSSICTMDIDDFKALKKQMVDWIQKSQKKIHVSGSEEVYGICVDLFSVV